MIFLVLSGDGGADVERPFWVVAGFMAGFSISPLAVASLSVREDMAQPAQPETLEGSGGAGVLDREMDVPSVDVDGGGGRTVSGMEEVCLRIRVR